MYTFSELTTMIDAILHYGVIVNKTIYKSETHEIAITTNDARTEFTFNKYDIKTKTTKPLLFLSYIKYPNDKVYYTIIYQNIHYNLTFISKEHNYRSDLYYILSNSMLFFVIDECWEELQNHKIKLYFDNNGSVLYFYRQENGTKDKTYIMKLQIINDVLYSLPVLNAMGTKTIPEKSFNNPVRLISNLLSRIKTYTRYMMCDAYGNTMKRHESASLITLMRKFKKHNSVYRIINENLSVSKVEIGLGVNKPFLSNNQLVDKFRKTIISDNLTKLIAPYRPRIGKYIVDNISSIGLSDSICVARNQTRFSFSNQEYNNFVQQLDNENIKVIDSYNGVIFTHISSYEHEIFLQLISDVSLKKNNIADIMSTNDIKPLLCKDMLSEEINNYLKLEV